MGDFVRYVVSIAMAFAYGSLLGFRIATNPVSTLGAIRLMFVFGFACLPGKGIARILMRHAHHHAAQQGMTRLILDVLPARTAVIGFYRRLGYTETGPYATESPVPMTYMERPITTDDILSTHRS
jgi:GNAT superfamily N-acetyltransferase